MYNHQNIMLLILCDIDINLIQGRPCLARYGRVTDNFFFYALPYFIEGGHTGGEKGQLILMRKWCLPLLEKYGAAVSGPDNSVGYTLKSVRYCCC